MESACQLSSKASDPAVKNFCEYLRIPSVQPNIDYTECVEFLKRQAQGLGLPVRVYEPKPKKPIVVITWNGRDPTLPSVLLNSHMDVVPVFKDMWTHEPFAAEIDAKGNIYARGSQDMKCVGIQYLEAVRRMKKAGVQLLRTLHIMFVPDEEIGGADGMRCFVKTNDFRALNVGFALDEGMASPTEEYPIFYGERYIWHVYVRCSGTPGHGSLMLPDTAGEKLRAVIDRFMDFRNHEKKRMENNPELYVGDITTINLTQVHGGVQSNVVPPELAVMFDVRLAVDVDEKEFEERINRWCREAGDGITIEYEQKDPKIQVTRLDKTNPWWIAFKGAAEQLNLKLKPRVFPGGTDSRYVRQIGVPALGFSPMNKTPVLLHDHDEYLNVDTFMEGIKIYETLIPAVANVEDRTG